MLLTLNLKVELLVVDVLDNSDHGGMLSLPIAAIDL